jgi:tripartite-type tricarboxylate transporter receptor subunit TctC
MRSLLLGFFAVIGLSPMVASAQSFPNRPITIVIPFPAGGPLDFLTRTIQPKLEASLGQPIIVENRPGATGNIGNAYVAKAEPDGYTLVVTATNMGVFPHMFPHLNYDPIKDLTVVSGLGETPTACVVNPSSPIKNFADLINEAKAKPGQLTFGSSGPGAPSHLIVELIGKRNNVKFTHVPYKGAAPAVNDVLGNFLSFLCTSFSNLVTLIKQEKLRALAIAAKARSPLLPDVPTIKDAGFGDIVDGTTYILLAPSKTPKPIIGRLAAAMRAALAEPSVKKAYNNLAYDVITRSPAQLTAEIKEQYDLWGPIIKELNLKLE